MKILFDARAMSGPCTGIGRYLRGLINALLQYHPEHEYRFFSRAPNAGPPATEPVGGWMQDNLWEHFGFGWYCRRAGADVVHSPQEGGPLITSGFQWAVTVHDMIPWRFSDLYIRNRLHGAYYRGKLLHVKRRADMVLTVSQATAADLRELLGLEDSRITVVHIPVDLAFQPAAEANIQAVRNKFSLEQPYFLAVGTAEPRKNLSHVLAAYRAFSAGMKDPPGLVLFGFEWRNSKSVDLIEEAGLSNVVRHLGGVPESGLPALYSGALAFLYPSYYEGYGLPVLEAMACGCPVITSNTSSLPEVADSAAILVDPSRPEQTTEALREFWRNPGLRADYQAKGLARVRRLSWQDAAAQTLAAYG